METYEEMGSTLKMLIKKVLKDHRGKEYSGREYKKLVNNAKDIAE